MPSRTVPSRVIFTSMSSVMSPYTPRWGVTQRAFSPTRTERLPSLAATSPRW